MKAWLAKPRALGISVVVGVLLLAPALPTGLAADDYLQLACLRGVRTVANPSMRGLDIFRFANGDPAVTRGLMDAGEFPWTADPRVKLAFWRPVTVLTHVVDQKLWPDSPMMAHAQSILWMALAMIGVGLLYRRWLGATWVAGLAGLMFAIDQAHAPAVAWIANRNAIVALAIGSAVLLAHDRWRRDGWKPGVVVAPALLGLALLAGESAIAIVAYLAAHALCLEGRSSRPARARILALAPHGVVVALWGIAHAAMGYGAAHSGVYVDLRANPGEFFTVLPERLPELLGAELVGPWSDMGVLYHYGPRGLTAAMVALAYAVVAIILVAAWPIVKRDPVARFFALGMLLAALPVCSTFPADRLLLFVSIGALGLVAMIFESARGFVGRGAVWLLAFVHLALSPLVDAARARSVLTVAAPIELAQETIPSTPDVTTKTMIFVNPPSDFFTAYFPVVRAMRGEPRPARERILASGTSAVIVTRVDASTVRVKPARGFLESDPERMLRSANAPFAIGQRIDLAGTSITIESLTPDGRPAEVSFRFDVALEDPSLIWLQWTHDGFAPFTPPPLGQSAELPAHPLLPEVLHAMEVEDRHR